MNTLDERKEYLVRLLESFKEGSLSMEEVLLAIRKRKPNQAKVDGAKDFARLVSDGRYEEAFTRYRFGLKNVRTRRKRRGKNNEA